MAHTTPRLAVLISGTGRNLQAIAEAALHNRLPATITGVISNRPGAYGLERARRLGLPVRVVNHRQYESRTAFESELSRVVDDCGADMVALAGFMRILGAPFVSRYEGRMFNIHPSLLPKYRGLNTHARALAAGDSWHGASVHFVTNELDSGPVVLQGKVDVRQEDDAGTLADRVMQTVETRIYPQALSWFAEGRLTMHEGRAWLDGRPLDTPMQLVPAE